MIVILPVMFCLYVVTVLNVYAAASTDSTINNRTTSEGPKTPSDSIENRSNSGPRYSPNDIINNANEFPYSTFAYSSVLNAPAIVHDGIILKNASPTQLALKKWGPDIKLVLNKFYKNHLMRLFRMEGSTGKDPGGFVSNNLDYKGRYISLIIGNVTKPSGKDFQISFVFSVTGAHGAYQLHFVHGPLFVKGWLDSNYYEKITPYSSRLIDLNNFIHDRLTVKQISIVMQNASTLNSLEFRIDLNRTTENPPVMLPGDNSYSVIGNITTPYDIILKNSRYIFHNLGINRLVTLELSPVADNGKLIANGWNLSNTHEWKDNNTNVNHLSLTAQRHVTAQELSPEVFYNLDIFQSLLKSGPRDWLFLVVVMTPLLLYRFRETSS